MHRRHRGIPLRTARTRPARREAQALRGWREWLHARACQQEQAAAQSISTGLVLLNGASVALAAVLVLGSIAQLTNFVVK